jgi:rod shape-determining protein MreC
MLRKSHYIALAAVALMTLVLLKLPNRAVTRLKVAIGSSFLPTFGLIGSSEGLVDHASNAIAPKKELLRQLKELENQNRELRVRSMQWESVARENLRLRQQLGLPRLRTDWNLKVGNVVARDPANWWRSLKIDLGARDGLVTNAPVLTAEGLVGRISEVGFAQSQVVLLGDPDCRVAVMVEETREHGVIAPESAGPLDDSLVDIAFLLSRSSQLKAGQRIVTSGDGGIFPKGIPVGHVVDTRSVGYGLYTEARAKLAVSIGTLEEVFVKLP